MAHLFLLWFTAVVTVVWVLAVPQHQVTAPTFDLCQTKTLRLRKVGETGYIKFDNTSLSGDVNGLGCVLKFESCSSCRIELEPVVDTYLQFFCKTGIFHSKYCSLGCDYLNIFDMYYMNETNKYYAGLGHNQDIFRSESSNVFVMLCHGGSAYSYNFKIRYSTTKKMKMFVGSSNTSSATGLINSPFFPHGYAQNHEVYEYTLTSTNADDYIQIMFDDWHLSETSSLYFINSNKHDQFNGESSRPVIISDSNQLKFTFNTGVSLTAGENREYIGFRAAYKFYGSCVHITMPKTNCKGPSYFKSSSGGRIHFSPSSPTRELYDCLWVVGTQAGFDGTLLKIIRLRSTGYLFKGENQLTIRAGISSFAPVRAIFDMLDNIDNGIPHFSSTGFYIRLNALLSSSDSVILTYASYKNAPGCGSDLFVCDNDRCIERSLMCDGYDHCGDNSDEVSGCADNSSHWDKSYQYTITIGVIVPMIISVFLIMVICLLFVMIRRCRRARLREARESSERLPTVSEDVSGRRRRRRHRRRLGLFGNADRDLPPTYDEAIQNPPGWYLNVAFGNPADPSLPQPPSYHEATGIDPLGTGANQQQPPGSPTSTDSSQSEVTVCSGNLSDSSSSSDEESTWGVYSGDGDGRRGRLGRHVSSSGSEAGTGERHYRSETRSPEQNEPAPVETSADTSQHRDQSVEASQTEENVLKVDKDSDIVADKDYEKKINDDNSDNIVVPVGPKPGSSNPQINDCRPKFGSVAARQEVEPQTCLKLTSDPVSAVPSTHHRNILSGSENTAEHIKKQKKRSRKSKWKKSNEQSVTFSGRPGGCTAHLSNEGASNITDNSNVGAHENTIGITESSKQKDWVHANPCPEEAVIQKKTEVTPLQQASGKLDAGYQVVVSVDNDEMLVVYDSANSSNEVICPPSDSNGSHVTAEAAQGIEADANARMKYDGREPAIGDFEFLNQAVRDQEPPELNGRNFDHSVKSVDYENPQGVRSWMPSSYQGNSGQLKFEDVQNRSDTNCSNDLTGQSYIHLRDNLDDTEDIYV